MYGETISGVTILRAFGASSKFLRDMLRCVDTVSQRLQALCTVINFIDRTRILTTGCGEVKRQFWPFIRCWHASVNRWLSIRFNLLSSVVVGVTALVSILTPRIDAALAGFALAFASTITNDVRVLAFCPESPLISWISLSFCSWYVWRSIRSSGDLISR
jgi:hypothetical protein